MILSGVLSGLVCFVGYLGSLIFDRIFLGRNARGNEFKVLRLLLLC